MDFSTFKRKYSKNKRDSDFLPVDFMQRVGASLAVQIHSTGARPQYQAKTANGGTALITPETYKKKFQDLFKTRLLNRHPNENENHYNWRLSVYSPVAKELYDRFKNMCFGAILQPNNYSISADTNTETEYIKKGQFDKAVSECLEFVIENPRGFIAVINEANTENEGDEFIGPQIEFVEPEDVIMWDHESVCFNDDRGKIFIDKTRQITILKDGTEIETIHNFGVLPFKELDNNFVQPFVCWADLLVRNMNDDETMVKQYSYPIKQQVLPACPTCMGSGKTSIKGEDGIFTPHTCNDCGGAGTMTFNPGDSYTISEEKLAKMGGAMQDMAKFITPDSGIPQYHLDRWQKFYEKCEESLHLRKKINATESGEAKREDRRDQYVYLMSLSNFVFDSLTWAMRYVSAYYNYSTSTGYTPQEFTLIRPKQFDLMTDSDLVNDFADIQSKTDDSMTLAELNYNVNSRVFRDDKVAAKINDVLYYTDTLYGISGPALRSKLLSGSFDATDKIIHDKGYKILLKMSREMTADVFCETELSVLIDRLMTEAQTLTPSGVYAQ